MVEQAGAELSDIVNKLSRDDKQRYVEKLYNIATCDPYLIPSSCCTPLLQCNKLPELEFPDIYMYLINFPSSFSGEAMKAYKSLDAYKYFVSGKVNNIFVWNQPMKRDRNSTLFVIKSKVTHSQRLSDPPVQVWVAIQDTGTVLNAHCTCMAGLTEACSHVAATLFAVSKAVEMRSTSCTSKPCDWMQPGSCKTSGDYAEASDIDFNKPHRRMQATHQALPSSCKPIQPPSSDETRNFFQQLKKTGVNSAVLSLLPLYAADFAPKAVQLKLPEPLPKLYSPDYLKLSYPQLIEKCEAVFHQITISANVCKAIEELTRQQRSRVWFDYRAGRITSSKFKAVVSTDPAMPSAYLVKSVCYPDAYKFSTAATRWGCQHEKDAVDSYIKRQSSAHDNHQVTDVGLFIHPDFPFLGASPDRTVTCTCCGDGILEVKCPFCVKDCNISDGIKRKDFPLETKDGKLRLKQCHQYYFQVQAQLGVTGKQYCDFVVWSPSNADSLHVERIVPNKAFFEENVEKARQFFRVCVLPELLGKWYTTANVGDNYFNSSCGTQNLCCFCRETDTGNGTIECQSADCKIKVFHMKCLGLKVLPRTKRYLCPNCKKFEDSQKRKSKLKEQ